MTCPIRNGLQQTPADGGKSEDRGKETAQFGVDPGSMFPDSCRSGAKTMAISKAKKAEKIKQLAGELEGSTTAIIGTFSKLTVAKDFELRKVIRATGGKYRVVKNKLAAISGTGTQIETALKGLKGVNSVAFTDGDPVALAKVFAKWAGENAEFEFKLGIVDGKLLDAEEVKALAAMPGKDEIFAKLLFLINAPAQRLATVINATGRDLAVVLNQGVEKEKFAGAA
jgi:large subunit ribosomal protein L10